MSEPWIWLAALAIWAGLFLFFAIAVWLRTRKIQASRDRVLAAIKQAEAMNER